MSYFTGFNTINVNQTTTTANIQVSATANLGNVSNVKIVGGTTGQVLSTDGTGNLTWIEGAAPLSIYRASLVTGNSVATTAEITAAIGVASPLNGSIFIDTSQRPTNHQPVYIYISGAWRQFMSTVNG
jgi:hypothetical protein